MDETFNFSVSDDGNVKVVINNQNGSSSTKIVKFEDFAKTININEQDINLPLFPRGLRKYKVVGDRTVVAIEYPATIIRESSWEGGDRVYKDVPVPNSVWFTLLSNNADGTYRIIKNIIFATDFMGLMNEETAFYKWPFPNHSLTYSPGICWGNDEGFSNIKDKCHLSNISSFFSMYFAANFNNDLSWHLSNVAMRLKEEGHILSRLEKEETFLDEWLIRSDYNFNSALQLLIG